MLQDEVNLLGSGVGDLASGGGGRLTVRIYAVALINFNFPEHGEAGRTRARVCSDARTAKRARH